MDTFTTAQKFDVRASLDSFVFQIILLYVTYKSKRVLQVPFDLQQVNSSQCSSAQSLVALSFTTLAPVKRFQTVDISVPSESIKFIDELIFTDIVMNNGVETVRLLKYGTILDDNLPTRSFIVTKNGEEVEFTGIKVTSIYDFNGTSSVLTSSFLKLSASLADTNDSAFSIIPAGQSLIVTHNVAALYNFETAGAGKFAFKPLTDFIIAGAKEKISSIDSAARISSVSNPVIAEVSGDVSKRELVVSKRAVDICANASRKSFIDVSYSEAKTLVNYAASYISSRGLSDTLYKAYYGTTSTTTVGNISRAVASENSSSRTLSCTDSLGACTSGVM